MMQPKRWRRDEKIPFSDMNIHPDILDHITKLVSNSLNRLTNRCVKIKSSSKQSIQNVELIDTDKLTVTGDLVVQGNVSSKTLESMSISTKILDVERLSSFTSDKVDCSAIESAIINSSVVNADKSKSNSITSESIITGIMAVTDVLYVGGTVFINGIANKIRSVKVVASTVIAKNIIAGSILDVVTNRIIGKLAYINRIKSSKITSTNIHSKHILAKDIEANSSVLRSIQSKHISADRAITTSIQSHDVDCVVFNGISVSEIITLLRTYKKSGMANITEEELRDIISKQKESMDKMEYTIAQCTKEMSRLRSQLDSHLSSRSMQLPQFKDILDMSKNTDKNCIGSIGGKVYMNSGRGVSKLSEQL